MMMRGLGRQLCLGVVLWAVMMAPPASAQEAAPGVNVEADELEVNNTTKTNVFRGNVVALRDGTLIKCDVMTVVNVDVKQPDGTMKSQVEVIHAKGKVTIKTDGETITSDWADIYDQQDKLIAGGNVTLVQDKNVVKGQKLTVNLKTKNTVMTGGRVKGSFVPK
jgi:lipopolysaccharide export system protein LptA